MSQEEIQKRQPVEYNLYRLIRQPPDSIEQHFGKPNKIIRHPKDCAHLPYCTEMDYKNGLITVLYKDNKALWFEFDSLHNHVWEFLPAIFALPDSAPSQVNDDVAMYRHVFPALEDVTFVRSQNHYDKVSWAVVVVE